MPSSVSAHSDIEFLSIVSENTDSSAKSNYLKWYYKTENGKVYKRLYNLQTNSWVGDWILVS